jgi:DNA/RNA endonuclease G (NUC1)
MFALYKKLSQKELKKTAKQIEKWFIDNPTRKVCNTDLYGGTKVRRGHVMEDLDSRNEK